MRAELAFPILGRAFRARGVDEALAEWLRVVWHFAEAGASPSRFRIELDADAQPEPPARGAVPCRVSLLGRELTWEATPGEWRMDCDEGGMRLRITPDRAEIALWPTRAGDTLQAALFVALCEAVRASGLVPLHAAVAERDGAATAFLARSGTGKSSTLISAIGAGWNALAEDFAWLEPASLRVFGWDRGLHLWPAGLARFGEPLGGLEAWRPGRDGKLYLPFERLGGVPGGAATLQRVALLRRDGARPGGWEPAAPRDAVRALWECVGVPLWQPSRGQAARTIATLLQRTAVSWLNLTDEPAELIGAAPPLSGSPG